jgi:hypothetical protein
MSYYERNHKKERIEMDEMRVKLSSKFMRNIVSKLMAKMIYKKFGYKVDIRLDELDVKVIDGDTTVKLNVEARLKNEEFTKIMKSIELE